MTERLNADYEFTGDVRLTGTGSVPNNSVTNSSIDASAAIARSKLAQETFAKYPLNLLNAVVHDDLTSRLSAAANDDLGLEGDTHGTGAPHLTSGDLAGNGSAVTRRARLFFGFPPEYDVGETVNLRAHCGMGTNVADQSATVDFEAFLIDQEGGVSGSDLVTTSATDMNSTTFADQDFTLTDTNLKPGSIIDIRVSLTVHDDATGSGVEAIIGAIWVLADIRG